MIGENPGESWRILLSVLQITSHLRSSAVMATARTVIGGVWARSCLNVRLGGHHSVPKMLMIPTGRSLIGVNHCTSRKTFNWDLKPRIWFEGMFKLNLSGILFYYEFRWLVPSLVCNTENRLGRGGADEIKSHKFFRGVDFNSLRLIRAPFEPKLSSNVDTTYFPTDEIDQTDNATHLKAQQNANGNQTRNDAPELSLPFIGYTFKRFDDYQGSSRRNNGWGSTHVRTKGFRALGVPANRVLREYPSFQGEYFAICPTSACRNLQIVCQQGSLTDTTFRCMSFYRLKVWPLTTKDTWGILWVVL